MGKIRRGKVPRLAETIPSVQPLLDADTLRFSFKHLDLTGNAKFSLTRCRDGYLKTLLERLRDLSRLTAKEFRTSRSSALRSHPIDFSETTEPQGFHALNEQLRLRAGVAISTHRKTSMGAFTGYCFWTLSTSCGSTPIMNFILHKGKG